MIPHRTVTLYQSIKAPDTLRQKLEAKLQEAPVPLKRKTYARTYWKAVAGLAACAALALLFWNPQRPSADLCVNGIQITDTPVAVSAQGLQRSAVPLSAENTLTIPLELPQKMLPSVEVSHGSISPAEESSAGPVSCLWTISLPLSDNSATLTVTRDGRSICYLLHVDADGVWYMERIN